MKMLTTMKRLRQEMGVTQDYVAYKIKVGRPYYTLIENGKVQPGSKTRERLCKFYNASHKELFGY